MMPRFIFGQALLGCVILINTAIMISTTDADVTSDGTMGTSVSHTGPLFRIEGGELKNPNLFHSFRDFSITADEIASFSGPGSVDNIIARVTGGRLSNIDGVLQSEIEGASLYFINPAGVMIGPNAILFIDGAFHVSTADYLSLGDSARFYASTQETSTLTSKPPTAFGFLNSDPARITVEGFIVGAEDETISLVGGGIDIKGGGAGDSTDETGGLIYTKGGDIQIVSVASPGEVTFTDQGPDVSAFTQLGDISISNGAMVDVSDFEDGSGNIYFRGKDMDVRGDGTIISSITKEKDGGGIDIQLEGDLTLSDPGVLSTLTVGEGRAGDIVMDVDNLTIEDGFEVSAISGPDAVGGAGDIHVKARNSITLSGDETFPAKLDASTKGEGNGGDIKIQTDTLMVMDHGLIATDTEGSGAGGSITITARDSVTITDEGVISASTLSEEEGGDAGDINITVLKDAFSDDLTENADPETEVVDDETAETAPTSPKGVLTVSGGGVIQSVSQGDGAGGDIEIKAEQVEILDEGAVLTDAHGPGSGGSIDIRARDSITVADNGMISASSLSNQDGGDAGDIQITVHANAITDDAIETSDASDPASNSPTSESSDAESTGLLSVSGGGVIQSVSQGDGAGGDVEIKAEQVDIFNEGAVLADIYGSGDGGHISITAAEAVNVSDSGRISATSKSEGVGGDAGGIQITIAPDALDDVGGEVEDQPESEFRSESDNNEVGLLTVSDNGVITSGSLGDGDGGDIAIDVKRLEIDQGYISSSVRGAGQGGDISINAKEEVSISGSGEDDAGLFGEYYGIYAQTLGTGDGGHVMIDTPALTLTKDGMINGQAYNSGRGGDVTINVETLDLTEGGTVTVSTRGAGDAGDIEINASESVSVSGHGAKLENSWIYSATHSAGDGGDITIRTPDLILDQDGAIFANTLGDDTRDGNTLGDGDAGDIKLETERLVLDNGGAVLAGSESSGKGGNIDITSDYSIHISNPSPSGTNAAGVESSGVYARAQASSAGGRISIQTHTLGMTEHGAISTSATNSGNAGDIDLNLQRLVMHSGSEVTSQSSGSGAAGEIAIQAGQEVRMKRSAISTEAQSADGGSILVDTPILEMADRSRLSAAVLGGSGDGGQIDINVNTLEVYQGSRIETSTGGAGDAGVITIDASEQINLSGLPSETTSGLFSISTGSGDAGQIRANSPLFMMNGNTTINTSGSASGKGGDIDLNANQLFMNEGASIEAKSSGSGDAGSITVHAGDKIQMENSTITTEALNADGGNISLFPGYMLYLIDSAITAAVAGGEGDGGNITIAKPKFVILNDSDIIANAYGGKGGNIDIRADYFLASAESVLDASSTLGVDGVVNVDAIDADVSGSITVLPDAFGDVTPILNERCEAYKRQEDSSLFIHGVSGLPAGPDDYLQVIY